MILFLLTLSRWNDFGWWVSKESDKSKNPHSETNPSQWSENKRGVLYYGRKPTLLLTISVRSSNLNTPKLSKYQVSLYQKICELRFDKNLTWKQVAVKLNELGWKGTRGAIHCDGTVCSTYFKIRKHFERQNTYHPPNVDDVKLVWE